MNKVLLDSIRSQAKDSFPNECCGVIIKEGASEALNPMPNLAADPGVSFLIDFSQILGKDISCVYHSHPMSSCEPSVTDKLYCNESQLPFFIYSLKDDDFSLLMPE